EKGAIRAADHEDINLLTLLPAATATGLQVKDVNNHWHEVESDPGTLVINVGDTLQECTDFYYKSTTHRVVNPQGDGAKKSRYSMPLFLHARGDVKLSSRYPTVETYWRERMRELGVQ
ncbi:MAG: 2OG-Fe(II) oxygenase family protein, partial [Gammaproteobacteria bacterium]|nr:2OG-Fe(II) oxygenase family protein [Gammaproteobacteria bacterium]